MRFQLKLAMCALMAATAVIPAQALANNEATQTAKPTDPDGQVRCRKIEVTGSLVKKGRVCKTIAEWRAITSSHNDAARRMVEEQTTRGGGQ